LRILAWNIRQGGGSRLKAISAALMRHEADVLVISEFRGGDAAGRLRVALAKLGYGHMTAMTPPPHRNGVLIAALNPLNELGPVCGGVAEPYRMVGAEIAGLRLCGVYMPNMLAKVPYWRGLIARLAWERGDALAIGDFNTCRAYVDEPGAIDATAYFLDEIAAAGFRDLWRHRYPEGREYSWYSHRGNGLRIDHAFLSPCLAARAGAIRYSHDERLAGLSDHSPLILDL